MSRQSAENDAPARAHYVPGEKCPLVGHVISWTSEEWIEGYGRCHGCGGMTRVKVRGNDLAPWGKALTHRVPRVTPPDSTAPAAPELLAGDA